MLEAYYSAERTSGIPEQTLPVPNRYADFQRPIQKILLRWGLVTKRSFHGYQFNTIVSVWFHVSSSQSNNTRSLEYWRFYCLCARHETCLPARSFGTPSSLNLAIDGRNVDFYALKKLPCVFLAKLKGKNQALLGQSTIHMI